uniref:Transposase n=1 Tax=Syphacia muris TaxID=451379 RepID=A0A0N5APJ0_9BILA
MVVCNIDTSTLREGDIVTDKESGKRYRVRKSVLSDKYSNGPHGLGDPEDNSLRRVEVDTLIAEMMNDQIENVECRKPLQGEVLFVSYNLFINTLSLVRVHDIQFREAITEKYLKLRSEYRRTGKTEKERALDSYLQWKRGHRSSSS